MNQPETYRMKKSFLGLAIVAILFVGSSGAMTGSDVTPIDVENPAIYSIAVTVNKAVVLQLPRKAIRVSVTQPQIAEAVVVAPDQILINGKATGATSLVVWFAPLSKRSPTKGERLDAPPPFVPVYTRSPNGS